MKKKEIEERQGDARIKHGHWLLEENKEILSTLSLPNLYQMRELKDQFAETFSAYFPDENDIGHDISDDLIGNTLVELDHLIRIKKIEKAISVRTDLNDIYSYISTKGDPEKTVAVFRGIKAKKMGTAGEKPYALKEGESRLSLLKSAIDNLQSDEL